MESFLFTNDYWEFVRFCWAMALGSFLGVAILPLVDRLADWLLSLREFV